MRITQNRLFDTEKLFVRENLREFKPKRHRWVYTTMTMDDKYHLIGQ